MSDPLFLPSKNVGLDFDRAAPPKFPTTGVYPSLQATPMRSCQPARRKECCSDGELSGTNYVCFAISLPLNGWSATGKPLGLLIEPERRKEKGTPSTCRIDSGVPMGESKPLGGPRWCSLVLRDPRRYAGSVAALSSSAIKRDQLSVVVWQK